MEPVNEPTNTQTNTEPAGAPDNAPQNTGSLIDQAAQPQGAPDAYDFSGSLPEGFVLDEAMSKAFGDICRKAGLTNDQANELAKYGFGWNKQMNDMQTTARAQQMEAEKTATIKALGPDMESTMRNINRSMNFFERKYPGFIQAVDASGLGNNLIVCRVLSEIGQMVSEDGGAGGQSRQSASNMYPNTDFSKYGG